MSPGIMAKKRLGVGVFALGCSCKDANAVSVSVSASPSATETSTTTATRQRARTDPSASATTDTLTVPSASSSFFWADTEADDFKPESSASTPRVSSLLRELHELEQSVVSWGRKSPCENHFSRPPPPPPPPPPPLAFPLQHPRKLKSGDNCNSKEGNNDFSPPQQHRNVKSRDNGNSKEEEAGGGGGRLEGTVAVVKESEDPLGDFRLSMLQLIVENGIVAGEELRELLRRFLSLNAPHHHDVILRAFAEIWDEVFAAAASHREPARPPRPRTPPRSRRSPPAWRM